MEPSSATERERLRHKRYRKYAKQCFVVFCLSVVLMIYAPFSGDPGWPIVLCGLVIGAALLFLRWRKLLRLSRPQIDKR